MRMLRSLAVVLLAVSACSNAGDAPDSASRGAATPAMLPADEAAVPSTASVVRDGTSPRLDDIPGALAVRWLEWSMAHGGWSASVTPLEAATGSEFTGYKPIELGHAPQVARSPDGRLLAVTSRDAGALFIYDLLAWERVAEIELIADDERPSARPFQPGLTAWFPDWGLLWTADGARMIAWRAHCWLTAEEGRCAGTWERDLWEIDISTGTAQRRAELDFAPSRVRLAPRGDRVYVLGVRTDLCCGIDPQGDPVIAAIDLATGSIIEVELTGMLAGQPRHWLGDESRYASYWPAIALAPDGSRLFVIDAVEDHVVVIDTGTMSIDRTIDFGTQPSRLSRLGTWLRSQLLRTAEAKGGPSYVRQAEVTADGRYLLITGSRPRGGPDEAEGFEWNERPAGLTVLDAETLSVVLHDADVGEIALSHNGRWLLATGSYWDPDALDEHGNGSLLAHGLRGMDLETLEWASELWPGKVVHLQGTSADGRYAYVTMEGPGIEHSRASGAGCEVACGRLVVLDLLQGELVAKRLLDGEGILRLLPWW